MGTVMSYEEFIARRFPKSETETPEPDTRDMESYNKALATLQHVGADLMSKLVKMMITVADADPEKKMTVTHSTYQILLEEGLPENKNLLVTTDERGMRIVRIPKDDLEEMKRRLAGGKQ